MLEHQVVGRLGLILGICVLGTACMGGEIGDGAPGVARLGPDASDPEIGNNASALVCPGASADVSASNGWRGSEALVPADGALRFEFQARPTAANLDGLVAVGAEDIDDVAKAAITVRFADDGFVDAGDGAIYNSDVAFPYDSGVWYSVSVFVDIPTETYDVEIGRCGEPRKTLIENASFRDNANVRGQLSTWAVWSSKSAALEVSTPAWIASGGCVPSTCETLDQVCGQPSDGCGGTLNCGGCSTGALCSSGICIAQPVSPPPGAVPSDSDYDHVVTLTGTQTGSSVASMINAQGSGSVLVRPLDGSGATITGGMKVPRSDVTLYGLTLTGKFGFANGTVMWGVHAEPAMFDTGGADGWRIRDSLWSGGAGSTQRQGCSGNVYAQSFIGDSVNWIIDNSTFKNYVPSQALCSTEHSEALYIECGARQGTIRNTTFTNNGNTAHIFFTWWPNQTQACYPDDICVEANTFNNTWDAYYDIDSRAELPSSLGISIAPGQGASLNGSSSWIRDCP